MSEQMTQEASHEVYLDEVLHYRPPLPIGQVGLNDIPELSAAAAGQATEPGYAWERLPRWLTEIEDAINRSDKAIVAVDMCSSVPLYAQLLRGLEFKRSYERAADLIAALSQTSPDNPNYPALREVHHSAQGKKDALTGLLRSVVQTVLYTLNKYDMADGDTQMSQDRLSARITALLSEQIDIYRVDRDSGDQESRWQIKYWAERQSSSYANLLAQVGYRTPEAIDAGIRMQQEGFNEFDARQAAKRTPLGPEGAEAYIRWQSDTLASMIAGNNRYRPARFISLDFADPTEIARSSQLATPESTRQMQLFSHALRSLFDPNQHIRGNIMSPLDLPDDSVTLITCFDGWPFYNSVEGLKQMQREQLVDQATEIIHGWYQKLAPGGKLVIFPWAIQDEVSLSTTLLDAVSERVSLLIGHEVSETKFHTANLRHHMSDSDRAIADTVSTIFTPGAMSTKGLIIQKPGRKLVNQHARDFAARLTLAYQISEQQDPRR